MTRSDHFFIRAIMFLVSPLIGIGARLREGWGGTIRFIASAFKPSPDFMLPRTAFDLIAAGGPALTPISAAAFHHGRHEAGVSKRSAARNI